MDSGRGRDGRESRDGRSHREASRERERERERDRERDRYDRDRRRGDEQRPEPRDREPPQRSSGRAGALPPRPQSRAGEADTRAAEPTRGNYKRVPSNPLVAEAARLARERLLREEAAGGGGGSGSENDSAPDKAAPRRRAAWRDDDDGEEEEEGQQRRQQAQAREEELEEGETEPGELLEEGAPPGFGGGSGAAAAGGGSAEKKKRKHAPIVWHTPPKQARVERDSAPGGGMHHAQSSSGIAALGAAAGSPGRPRSAAEIARAELEAFARAQAELDDRGGRGYMKDSPDVSSPEEEEHILREGRSELRPGVSEEGGGTSPGTAPAPKPGSRWLFDDADAAAAEQPRAGPAPLGGGSPGGERNGQPLGSSDEEAGASPARSPMEDSEEDIKPFKRAVSMLDECRSVDRYEKLNRINEGTYGVVYRARSRDSGEICALKKVKLEKEREGFPLTSVREINILLSLHHPNIVNVSEVVVGSSLDSVFMVMEYADHDLKAVMENRMTQPFSIAEVKCLMRQLLSGVAYLHSHWVLHRDLKTSNILYTNRGELKLCDFGLARQYGSPLKPYTHMVVTLWYRAIELLLGVKTYSTAVDVWSCGCIMAELLAREPLFPGKNEMEQITLIFKTLGTPTEESWPGLSKLPNYRRFNFASGHPNVLRKKFPPPGLVFDGRPALSDAGFDLLSRLLEYSPERRISAEEALEHPWFREHPLPKDQALMPTFPATNDAVHAHPGAAKLLKK